MMFLATFSIVLCSDMLNIEMLLSSNLKYNLFFKKLKLFRN